MGSLSHGSCVARMLDYTFVYVQSRLSYIAGQMFELEQANSTTRDETFRFDKSIIRCVHTYVPCTNDKLGNNSSFIKFRKIRTRFLDENPCGFVQIF